MLATGSRRFGMKIMASQVQYDDDDDEEIDPTKTLILDPSRNGQSPPPLPAPNRHHHLLSTDSALVIRQLPSLGLSFQLWPAATTLVTLLDHHRCEPSPTPFSSLISALPLPRPRVLELGSGTGLLGIAAAVTLGAIVTVTDLPHVLPNLQYNVDSNYGVLGRSGGSVRVAALRWGERADFEAVGGEFDLVVASDVVYHQQLFEPLLETLRFFLWGGEEKVVFVMAHLRRWKKDSIFFKRAKKLFEVEVLHVDSPASGSRIGVVVYSFAGKRQKKRSDGVCCKQ